MKTAYREISVFSIIQEIQTSGHSPLQIIGDDFNQYIIKNDGGKNPPYEIINEFLAHEFLKIWNIPTPEGVVCSLDTSKISVKKFSFRHKDTFYLNPTFGLEWIEALDVNQFTPFDKRFFNKIINPIDLIKISLFDEWIMNEDRKETNYNLILKVINDKFEIIPIDHGMILHSLPYRDLEVSYYMSRSNDYLLSSDFAKSIKNNTIRNQQFINNHREYFYLCISKCEIEFENILRKIPHTKFLNEKDISQLYEYLFSKEKNNKVFIEHVRQLGRI